MQNPPKSVWLSVARRHGEAWRGVARRGEARRGEAWLGRRGAKFEPRCVEGGGVYPTLKGGTLPGGQEPLGPDQLRFFTALFWPFWQPPFFHRFFDTIFNRFWFDFASQLGSQNPPKSMKNRCQDAFHLGLDFLMDF